jgi:hypothetical protein
VIGQSAPDIFVGPPMDVVAQGGPVAVDRCPAQPGGPGWPQGVILDGDLAGRTRSKPDGYAEMPSLGPTVTPPEPRYHHSIPLITGNQLPAHGGNRLNLALAAWPDN